MFPTVSTLTASLDEFTVSLTVLLPEPELTKDETYLRASAALVSILAQGAVALLRPSEKSDLGESGEKLFARSSYSSFAAARGERSPTTA